MNLACAEMRKPKKCLIISNSCVLTMDEVMEELKKKKNKKNSKTMRKKKENKTNKKKE
jgi:hypothetical protein